VKSEKQEIELQGDTLAPGFSRFARQVSQYNSGVILKDKE